MSKSLVRIITLLAVLIGSTAAHADQPTLSGRWSASAMVVQWVIGEWGDACGPKPGGGGAPAGVVTITQQGNELAMSGAGRSYSTTQCWEQFPGMVRTRHASGKRGWRNVCKSSPGDPRQTTVVTNISATDDTIGFSETGQYQFVVKGQNCTASVRRTRSFRLIQRDGEPPAKKTQPDPKPSAAPPPPKPQPPPSPPPARCVERGEPARLEVRPARKLMRGGETFEFRAIVTDEAGCTLGVRPTWKLVGEPTGVSSKGDGSVTVADDAPDGTAELSAALGNQSVKVSVEVVSKERFEALLASGSFTRDGESTDSAVALIEGGSVGGGAARGGGTDRRKLLFAGVIGGLALLTGIAALVLGLRGHKRRDDAEDAAEQQPSAGAAPPPEPAPSVPAISAKICPLCGERYPPDAECCGNDGATLVPIN